MLRATGRTLLTGMITLLPVVLTAYLLYWFIVTMESLLGTLLKLTLPDGLYRPGMGVAAALLIILAVGLLMQAYLVQHLFRLSEQLLYRVPLIRSIYRSISDFFQFFSPGKQREFGRVVAVTLGDSNIQMVGFITQDKAENLPTELRSDDTVLVYLPLSYAIGGHTVLIPRRHVRPLDMSMDEAMRFTLTAGVTGAQSAKPAARGPAVSG